MFCGVLSPQTIQGFLRKIKAISILQQVYFYFCCANITDICKAIVDKSTDLLTQIRAAAPNFNNGQRILLLYVLVLKSPFYIRSLINKMNFICKVLFFSKYLFKYYLYGI